MNEFEALVATYLDETLDDAQKQSLAGYLESDPELRRRFAQLVRNHRALEVQLADEPSGRFSKAVERAMDGALPPSVRPAGRESGRRLRFPVAVRILLGVAAALLAAFGAYSLLGPAIPGEAMATVTQVSGNAVRINARGIENKLTVGMRLHAGDRLVASASAQAQLQMKDRSIIDLNETTTLQLGGAALKGASADALRLELGTLYCEIAPRAAGAKPFLIGTPAGHRVTVLGTKFELLAKGRRTEVRVEEGRVRLATATGSDEAGELMKLQADGQQLAKPEPMGLYEVARWKFKQDQVPAGTILFQDDFEKGGANWSVSQGRMEIVAGEGMNKSHALQMIWDKGSRGAVLCNHVNRHRSYEVTFMVRIPSPGAFNMGTHMAPPWTWPEEVMPATILHQRYHKAFRAGAWLRYVLTVRDMIKEDVIWEGKGKIAELTGHLPEPFARVVLFVKQAGDADLLYVDNVVIRKLDD